MKLSARSPILAAHAVAFATCVSAQWVNYPAAGVPMTPSGVPNLGAPTPKTADSKPDFSGIWEADNTRSVRPCPVSSCQENPISEQWGDIAAGLPGPLPFQSWAAEVVKQRKARNGGDDPETKCLPLGVPRIHTSAQLRKFIQTPGLLLILTEFNASYRQIFTDGRPLPVDPQPSWNGYSSGKWEGDTLVVETNGLREMWLDRAGSPLTEAARVTERFRRLNYGNMEVEITVNDPKAYTRSWSTKVHQFLVVNTELLDYICLENEKDLKHLGAK